MKKQLFNDGKATLLETERSTISAGSKEYLEGRLEEQHTRMGILEKALELCLLGMLGLDSTPHNRELAEKLIYIIEDVVMESLFEPCANDCSVTNCNSPQAIKDEPVNN